jgi:hypothetical protein
VLCRLQFRGNIIAGFRPETSVRRIIRRSLAIIKRPKNFWRNSKFKRAIRRPGLNIPFFMKITRGNSLQLKEINDLNE